MWFSALRSDLSELSNLPQRATHARAMSSRCQPPFAPVLSSGYPPGKAVRANRSRSCCVDHPG